MQTDISIGNALKLDSNTIYISTKRTPGEHAKEKSELSTLAG